MEAKLVITMGSYQLWSKYTRKLGQQEKSMELSLLEKAQKIYDEKWKDKKVILSSGNIGKVVGFVKQSMSINNKWDGYYVNRLIVKIGKSIFIVQLNDIVGIEVKK
ncbi:MAG: hypothetical protein IMZ52_03020 [Actinobacteria bacterium]|nr:hypothetical protein [Actinomycetota bacterium]